MLEILEQTKSEDTYRGWLTGKDNFRYALAKTAGYKANRTENVKPEHLDAIFAHAVTRWGFEYTDGQEADDAIAIEHARSQYKSLVISDDKDFLQLPGKHYRPRKGNLVEISHFEGLKNFYRQILTGDSCDNIIGLYGIGPVKAEKILSCCRTEQELYSACVAAYAGNKERVIENGQLLWLRRTDGEIWQPPV